MQTLGEWLNDRSADVPETLWRHIDAHVTSSDVRDADALVGLQRLTEAQVAHMRTLSGEPRLDALDLLTVDATVTYLLELAATRADDLDRFAGDLMTVVAHP